MDESIGIQTGWIAPDDTFYPCGEMSHSGWAWRFKEMVAETGVKFPEDPSSMLAHKLELEMVQKGWIRKANKDAYYLRPQDKHRAVDYALMYTKEPEIYLDYINGHSEFIPLVRHTESTRDIVKRLLRALWG